jgi:hypothetical protein
VVQRVGDACRKHGKALGVGGINQDVDARRCIAMGSRFLLSGNDHSFIIAGSMERAKFFRDPVLMDLGGLRPPHALDHLTVGTEVSFDDG